MSALTKELVDEIQGCRTVSADGKRVLYDLTKGVDFERPRKTAEALAAVFYVNEVSKWFTRKDKDITYSPTCTVEMRFQEIHSKAMKSVLEDFHTDLKNDDLRNAFTRLMVYGLNGGFIYTNNILSGGLAGPTMEGAGIMLQDLQNDSLLDKMMSDISTNLEIIEVGSPS